MSAGKKWITAIVALLTLSVTTSVALAVLANNGMNEIIPQYYERAVHYDDAIDEANKSVSLGWRVRATIAGGVIAVEARDAAGKLVEGKVHVTGYQRAHASEPIDVDLARATDGTYRATDKASRLGAHDLIITIDRGSDHFVQRASLEAR